MGLRQEASLAKKLGSCETRGVTLAFEPTPAMKTTKAYGLQMQAHNNTLVTATLAILNSALSELSFCRIILETLINLQ